MIFQCASNDTILQFLFHVDKKIPFQIYYVALETLLEDCINNIRTAFCSVNEEASNDAHGVGAKLHGTLSSANDPLERKCHYHFSRITAMHVHNDL
jgi:hypothetical protein